MHLSSYFLRVLPWPCHVCRRHCRRQCHRLYPTPTVINVIVVCVVRRHCKHLVSCRLPYAPPPPLYLYRSCRCHIHQPPTDWFQSCVEHFSMSLLHFAFLPKMQCSRTKTPHDFFYKRTNPLCMVICLQCPGLALVYSFCCVRSARLISWVMCP